MRKRLAHPLIVAISLAMSAVISPPQAPAAFAAGQVGNGTPASCTEAQLATALAGGGTVTFNCGGPKTILLTSQKIINQNTVIQGGGVITLTGGLATRLLYVQGTSLTLSDIILDSAFGIGGDGGAIVSSGALTLTNVTIKNSQTQSSYCGGAIWSNGSNYIFNSHFESNSGGYGGGAICTGTTGKPTFEVVDSDFILNKATNTSNGYGGAILVQQNATLNVSGGNFNLNSGQTGGAIFVSQGATATIRSENVALPVSIAVNSSAHDGAGIYNLGTLNLNRVNLVGNTAPMNTILDGYGGGIANLGTMTLHNSTLRNNEGRFGGGLFVGGSLNAAKADIQRTTFFQNKAGSTGGGLYTNVDTTVVTITNSVFDKNTAGVGAGAARFNARLSIFNSSFTDNQASSAGGGLQIGAGPSTDPTYVSVTSVTFSGNTATGNQGGGIYNQGYTILKNATLKGNTNGVFNLATLHIGNSVLDNPGSLNCDGVGSPVSSDGYNFANDASCALNSPGDQKGVGLDSKLGARQLNDNGSNTTSFHLPLAGSPLINAALNCPSLDQRSALRAGACEIGAVEYLGLAYRANFPVAFK